MFAEVLFLFYQASLLGSREGKVGPDSVHFSRSVMSNSLRPHGLQHAGPPCPSPTPRVYSNSCPSIQSVMPSNHLISCRPLLLLPSVFTNIGVFSSSWIFMSGGQNIGASASASVLPMNIQDWFRDSFWKLIGPFPLAEGAPESCTPRAISLNSECLKFEIRAPSGLDIFSTRAPILRAFYFIFVSYAHRRHKSFSRPRYLFTAYKLPTSFLGLKNHCGRWLQPRN